MLYSLRISIIRLSTKNQNYITNSMQNFVISNYTHHQTSVDLMKCVFPRNAPRQSIFIIFVVSGVGVYLYDCFHALIINIMSNRITFQIHI